MKIIALATGKGGVAKSTTAVHLACEAEARGEPAAIIDMDEGQNSAMEWARVRGRKEPKVVAVKGPKLREEIEKLRAAGIKWVFIDLPGRLELSAFGIEAADFVLILCTPSSFDFKGSLKTVQTCQRSERRYAYLLARVPLQGNKSRAKHFSKDLQGFSQPVCPIWIGHRQAIPDAIAEGRSIREYEPGGSSQVEFYMLFLWLKEQFGEQKTQPHR
jgi:chromosome partitioning protein